MDFPDRAPMVLIVEDDAATAALETSLLESRGMLSTVCATGAEALRQLSEMRFDAVLLDLGLPDRDGTDLIVEIRERSTVPIMVVTVRSKAEALAQCLANGADDFVGKPFAPVELTSRLERLLQRAGANGTGRSAVGAGASDGMEFIAIGAAALFLRSGELVGPDGATCRLTGRELELASLLFRQPHEVTPRAAIYKALDRGSSSLSNRSIDLHVSRLRRKLRSVGCDDAVIETVRGTGYRFRPPSG
ncbi:MAG: response regulator transcription factor [Azospirillaceae bacterium]